MIYTAKNLSHKTKRANNFSSSKFYSSETWGQCQTHTRNYRVLVYWCPPLILCSNPTDDRRVCRTSAPSTACLPNWLKQKGTKVQSERCLFPFYLVPLGEPQYTAMVRMGGGVVKCAVYIFVQRTSAVIDILWAWLSENLLQIGKRRKKPTAAAAAATFHLPLATATRYSRVSL